MQIDGDAGRLRVLLEQGEARLDERVRVDQPEAQLAPLLGSIARRVDLGPSGFLEELDRGLGVMSVPSAEPAPERLAASRKEGDTRCSGGQRPAGFLSAFLFFYLFSK